MGLLEGKVAVVTGAGSGMGRASAAVFVREGARVVVGDISGAEADTARDLGDAALAVRCDVTREDDVEALVQAAVEQFGGVHTVLNVAGVADAALVADATVEQFERTIAIDLRGVLFGIKHGIRAMVAGGEGGAIVNWSSIGGLNSSPATAVYGAAKAGVISLTKTAAIEYAKRGIRVNAVCPGFIKTEIMGAMLDQYPGATDNTPMRRLGRAEEVAEVAAFLASDRASFVTGAVVPVDGGRSVQLA